MNKQNAKKIIDILKSTYPDATCSLDFTTPFEMVVAVMLSAQCTDERVNKTTPILFKRCKTISDYVDIDIKELEDIIHPCGFFKNKARNTSSINHILKFILMVLSLLFFYYQNLLIYLFFYKLIIPMLNILYS